MERMKWNDAQVWLPTLLLPDFVLFPQCRIDVRILDAAIRHQLEPYFEGGGVVNVFWAPVVDSAQGDALQVSQVGTISKMMIRGYAERGKDQAGEPPLRVTLMGLYRIRCEALKAIDDRIVSRFQILQETMPGDTGSWSRLMESIRTWLFLLMMYIDIPIPANLLGVGEAESPEALVNRLCMELPFEPAIKQELLEVPDVYLRGERLCRYLQRAVEVFQTRGDSPTPKPS